jgi:hypothetical protein
MTSEHIGAAKAKGIGGLGARELTILEIRLGINTLPLTRRVAIYPTRRPTLRTHLISAPETTSGRHATWAICLTHPITHDIWGRAHTLRRKYNRGRGEAIQACKATRITLRALRRGVRGVNAFFKARGGLKLREKRRMTLERQMALHG